MEEIMKPFSFLNSFTVYMDHDYAKQLSTPDGPEPTALNHNSEDYEEPQEPFSIPNTPVSLDHNYAQQPTMTAKPTVLSPNIEEAGKCHHCKECNFKTTLATKLFRHYRRIHPGSVHDVGAVENEPSKSSSSSKTRPSKKLRSHRQSSQRHRLLKDRQTFASIPSLDLPFGCSLCGFRTSVMNALLMHETKHWKKYAQQCSICSYSASSARIVKRHIFRDHSEHQKETESCLLETQRNSQASKDGTDVECYHQESLSTRGMIGQSFSSVQRTPHNSSNWNKGRLRKKNHCHLCQYSTYNKVALEEHVAMHDRTDGFQCDYSSNRFPKKSFTSLHMRRDHGHPIVVIKPKKKQILTPDKMKPLVKQQAAFPRHQKSRHSRTIEASVFLCAHCPFWARYVSKFHAHMTIKHQSTPDRTLSIRQIPEDHYTEYRRKMRVPKSTKYGLRRGWQFADGNFVGKQVEMKSEDNYPDDISLFSTKPTPFEGFLLSPEERNEKRRMDGEVIASSEQLKLNIFEDEMREARKKIHETNQAIDNNHRAMEKCMKKMKTWSKLVFLKEDEIYLLQNRIAMIKQKAELAEKEINDLTSKQQDELKRTKEALKMKMKTELDLRSEQCKVLELKLIGADGTSVKLTEEKIKVLEAQFQRVISGLQDLQQGENQLAEDLKIAEESHTGILQVLQVLQLELEALESDSQKFLLDNPQNQMDQLVSDTENGIQMIASLEGRLLKILLHKAVVQVRRKKITWIEKLDKNFSVDED